MIKKNTTRNSDET